MNRRIFLKRLVYLAGLSLINPAMLSAEVPALTSFNEAPFTFSLDELDVDDITMMFDTHMIQEAAKRLADFVDNSIGEKIIKEIKNGSSD